jgi:hypothetical protein
VHCTARLTRTAARRRIATSAMMDAAPTKNRPALAERTNDEPELDGDDKRRRASIEGQLAEDVSPPPRAKRVKTPVNYVGKEEDADKACGVEEAPESSEYAEQEDAWEKGSESGEDSAEDDDNDESEEEEDVASEEEEDIWYDSSKNKPPPKSLFENPLTKGELKAVLAVIATCDGSETSTFVQLQAEVILDVPSFSLNDKKPEIRSLMREAVVPRAKKADSEDKLVAKTKKKKTAPKKKTVKKITEAPRFEDNPRVRFGLTTADHKSDSDKAAQSALNKAAKAAAITAEATIWGLGEDRLGSRMDRAVKLLARVADPKDPYRTGDARWYIKREK